MMIWYNNNLYIAFSKIGLILNFIVINGIIVNHLFLTCIIFNFISIYIFLILLFDKAL